MTTSRYMKLRRNKPLVLLITIFTVLIVGFIFFREGTLPVNKKEPETKIFIIKPGDGLIEIARNLKKEELIRNRVVFFTVVKQLGIEKKIQAGDFRLSQSMNAYEIARNLTHGTLDVWLQIIEGLRKEEIADKVEDTLGIPEQEFLAEAKEGFLFPDTYLIPKDATSGAVHTILKNNFDVKFTDEIKQRGARLGLTPEEIIIVASLVEKEGRTDEDRPEVASVILKRLGIGMKLDIDATLQYALGYQSGEKTWWKKNLTEADKTINSPYNTYTLAGLPPTPICNPGLSSINAVVNANPNTPYLFYLHGTDGKLRLAQTLEEHERNIERYIK